jgi:3-oxoacyl-[acyl-carrier protein] reductase
MHNVIVKGGSRGLGLGIARTLAAGGTSMFGTRHQKAVGPIYGLVNNAGIGTSGLLATLSEAEIERTLSSTLYHRYCSHGVSFEK